ncbi:MAG: AraC family transcriptional regulator ligand-binding domain-containing protein, partial [Luminiphilus sp.]
LTQGDTLPNKGHLWPNVAMETSTPAQYLLILIGIVLQRGCSLDAICEGTNLSLEELGQTGTRVGEPEADKIVSNALQVTGDAALGLEVGQQINLAAHAVVGQTFMACTDLTEVLETLVKYGPLMTGGQTKLHPFHDRHRDRTGFELELQTPSLTRRFTHDVIFSAAQKALSDLLQSPVDQIEVSFPYPRPADTTPFGTIFGSAVFFGKDRAVMSLPNTIMQRPLPTSNATLRGLYDAECARLLTHLTDSTSCTEKTLAALEKLEGQYPQLEQMASMLNLSTRTYRRRLEAEGSSFQSLLDRVRLQHALTHLRKPHGSISQTAVALGFNDASNFRRAFSQWCGESPTQWRARYRRETATTPTESIDG